MRKIEKYINDLKKKIDYWSFLYYIKNKPKVSDYEYDSALLELKKLEQIKSKKLIKNIGYHIENSKFNNVKYDIPMLSLNNIFNKNDFLNFDHKLSKKINFNKNIKYCCELKIDGIAISILYKNGILFSISTRGDGLNGENITKNINLIYNIPKKIDLLNKVSLIEIRGEAFIKKSFFLNINQFLQSKKHKIFSNRRNATSGILRTINPPSFFKKKIKFYCYGIAKIVNMKISDSHIKNLKIINNLGIPINNKTVCFYKKDKILKFYKNILLNRNKLNYDIDGIVIKVNSLKLQNKIGNSSTAPKWAIAYKFPAKEKITKINSVKFKIGRTGIITPIAIIEPVNISGVIITQVNLYNFNKIIKLNLMIGDTIIISRAGDVIPKILKVIFYKRQISKLKLIKIPKKCPKCNFNVKIINKSILYCSAGLKCIGQFKKVLYHFISSIGIKGINCKTINTLIKNKLINSFKDFFTLKIENLLLIKRIKLKSAQKILNNINNIKNIKFRNFIYALGIKNVGKDIANKLALNFKNLDNLISAKLFHITKINNIGNITANNIYKFFKNKNNIKVIKELIENHINIVYLFK